MENKMSKKIRVQYTVHDKNRNIVKQQTDFCVSDETKNELLMAVVPETREKFSMTGSGFNLKTALYWNARLMDGLKKTVPSTDIPCKIRDWKAYKEILFKDVGEGE